MKARLPRILFSCLLAAMSAQAETTLISESTNITLQEDTTNINSWYQGNISDVQRIDFTIDGQGQYALHFQATGKPDQNEAMIDLVCRGSDTGGGISETYVTLKQLSELSFSAEGADYSSSWVSAIHIEGQQSNAMLTISDISGDVSISGFRGANLEDSTVLVSGSRDYDATILVERVGGQLAITGNSAENVRNMFYTLGLNASTYPQREKSSNARIILRDIAGGIDLSNNVQHKAYMGVSGLLFAYNGGRGEATITMNNIGQGITLANNEIDAYGIVVAMAGSTQGGYGLFTGNANISITNVDGSVNITGNKASGCGGLLLIGDVCNLEISNIHGDVLFTDNTGGSAGALYIAPDPKDDQTERSFVRLSADYGDIIFRGNMVSDGTLSQANAMYIGPNMDIHFQASTGRTLALYDPVVVGDTPEGIPESTIHLNADGREGTILFSGEYVDTSNPENLTSYLTGETLQYGGTVRIDHLAAIQTDSYSQQGGVLTMGNGASLVANGDISLNNLQIQLDPGMKPVYLESGGQFSLSGDLQLSGDWKSVSTDTDLLQIRSKEEGISPETSSFSDDGVIYALSTSWNYLQDEDIWELILNPQDIQPIGVADYMVGTSTANSMLSSAANMKSLSDIALNQLDFYRFLERGKAAVWLSGLGGFTMQRSQGSTEGFDYQGGGYALGVNYRVASEWTVGAALGQMFGKNIGRDYASTNTQDSIMGLIDTVWFRKLNNQHSIAISGAIAYGSTYNDLDTTFPDGQHANGDWNNLSYSGIFQATWHIALKDNYVLSPSIGLEYTDVRQEAFRETQDITRRFDRGHFRNLALPIGVSLSKVFTLPNGNPWHNSVSIHYLPDIYRHRAETSANFNGFAWDVHGSDSARNAVRVGVFSRLALSTAWDVSCSYQLEARSDTLQQSCSIGVGYSF